MYFLIRLLFNAVGLWVAAQIFPGPGNITVTGSNWLITLVVVGAIFGIINAVIKPILAALTCPLYILTLGLFTFVVNALMLLLTSVIAQSLGLGFQVKDFPAALGGAIVISIVSFVLSLLVSEDRSRR